MLNHIIIHGRLTKDPDLRTVLNTGKKMCLFTIACDRPKEGTDFISCVAWEKTGDTISNYFAKGQEIIVNGRLQFRDWEDKSGNKQHTAEILVNGFDFCGSKSNKAESKKEPVYAEVDDDEELPF